MQLAQDLMFVQLVRETCCRCGVVFAMPKELNEALLNDRGRSFYCPNGHGQHYLGESEADKQKRLRTYAENSLAVERARHDQTKASLRSQKGVATRIKNRVKNGVCPCCNRTFSDLARHMASKHPDFAEDKPHA